MKWRFFECWEKDFLSKVENCFNVVPLNRSEVEFKNEMYKAGFKKLSDFNKLFSGVFSKQIATMASQLRSYLEFDQVTIRHKTKRGPKSPPGNLAFHLFIILEAAKGDPHKIRMVYDFLMSGKVHSKLSSEEEKRVMTFNLGNPKNTKWANVFKQSMKRVYLSQIPKHELPFKENKFEETVIIQTQLLEVRYGVKVTD